jgi:hypothetical protein
MKSSSVRIAATGDRCVGTRVVLSARVRRRPLLLIERSYELAEWSGWSVRPREDPKQHAKEVLGIESQPNITQRLGIP